VEQEQFAWVIGLGDTEDWSEPLLSYYHLQGRAGERHRLLAFTTQMGAEAYIEKWVRNNPQEYMSLLASIWGNVDLLGSALAREEFGVRPLSRAGLERLAAELDMDYSIVPGPLP
jgi:hypothetical protein